MELEALFDAVIVVPLENEETTYGSIIVPDIGKDRNEHGTVVEVGPGRIVSGHGFVETIIKPGDKVVLPTVGFTKLQHNGEEYYIGPENQILAKLNPKMDVEQVLEETKENLTEEEIKDLTNE